jgi:hypothetical protein
MSELFDANDIPPVVRLLLAEAGSSRTSIDALLPELERQAQWSLTNFSYLNDENTEVDRSKFRIVSTDSLNPFVAEGKCMEPKCRRKTAEEFARSICLYADEVVVPDFFTYYALHADRWNDTNRLEFAAARSSLEILAPLIRDGVIRFSSGMIGMCRSCHGELQNRADDLAKSICRDFEASLDLETWTDAVGVDVGDLLGSRLVVSVPTSKRQLRALRSGKANLEDFAAAKLRELARPQIVSTLAQALVASRAGAMLSSSSFVEALAIGNYDDELKYTKGEVPGLNDFASAKLPWIGNLTIEQVRQLKSEAQMSLSRLREQFVGCSTLGVGEPRDVSEVIGHLRQEVEEVRADLARIQILDGRRRIHVAAGVTTLTVTLLGLARDVVSIGESVAALVALFSLLHQSVGKHDDELAKIESRPAYALFRAKELQCGVE